MQTAMRLAVYLYRMQPIDALKAATSGSYLGITGNEAKTLTNGSNADFVILEAKSFNELITRFDQNLTKLVVKDGETVYQK